MYNKSTIVAMLLAAASAEITRSDFWNTNDWNDQQATYQIRVRNGNARGTTPSTDSWVRGGWSRVRHTRYSNLSNVQQVQSVFSQANWDAWFPNANAIYSYDLFLRAVGKYPAFCGESNSPNGLSDADTCRREVAALLAHIQVTSAGLTVWEDAACVDSWDAAVCGFKTAISSTTGPITSPTDSFFYARGPAGLEGDVDYAAFSKSFFEGEDREQELLNDPNRVAMDAYTGLASAVWKFTAPGQYGPSAHMVMAGYFAPNALDLSAGHTNGFGTTSLIMKSSDCGGWQLSDGANARKNAFNQYLGDLGLATESDNLDCDKMWPTLQWGSSASYRLYFAQDWSNVDRCNVVDWTTPYPASVRDSYKQCVCDLILTGSEKTEQCSQRKTYTDPAVGPEPTGSTL